MAVPQVIAHRFTRLALAGTVPSARDRKEFHLMGAEKLAAFTEAWSAMTFQTLHANQELMLSFMRSSWPPWTNLQPTAKSALQMSNAAMDIIQKGMAPVHRRAVANAKRLGRTKFK